MKNWNILGKTLEKDKIVDVLLKNRGLLSEESVELFLNPKSLDLVLEDLGEDFNSGLQEATRVILEAVENGIPIVIHGDYDADGICATAIMYRTIKEELGYPNVVHVIPNRFEHGYGLSNSSIDHSVEKVKNSFGYEGKILFLTVDSGVTSVDQVSYINSLGHEIIITDHHQKPSKLPECKVLVWSDLVVGSSIAWFLSRSLGSTDENSICFAALATVTDIQPVVGVNRSIVKEGLIVLNNNPPTSLKALIDLVGKNRTELTTYDLGWVIGPRLNASGRIEDAENSLKLLLADSYEDAMFEAKMLNQINTARQDKTIEMYDIANSLHDEEMPKIIISYSDDYHEGIIGLVAARLAKTYSRPAIVISTSATEDNAKGSVRSVPGIDITKVLREHEGLFINVGGHPLAAGFTIDKNKIPELKEALVNYAQHHFDDELLRPSIEIDLEIPASTVDIELYRSIERLQPFGVGNREPLFVTKSMGIISINFVGAERSHVSFMVNSDNKSLKAIYFNGTGFFKGVSLGDSIDLVYTIGVNEFRGETNVQLIVKDFRISNE